MANNFGARITAASRQDPPASTHSLVIELGAELFPAIEAHALACGTNPSALVALWIKPYVRDLCLHRPPS